MRTFRWCHAITLSYLKVKLLPPQGISLCIFVFNINLLSFTKIKHTKIDWYMHKLHISEWSKGRVAYEQLTPVWAFCISENQPVIHTTSTRRGIIPFQNRTLQWGREERKFVRLSWHVSIVSWQTGQVKRRHLLPQLEPSRATAVISHHTENAQSRLGGL